MRIVASMVKGLGARQARRFKKTWPDGLELSSQGLQEARHRGFDLSRLVAEDATYRADLANARGNHGKRMSAAIETYERGLESQESSGLRDALNLAIAKAGQEYLRETEAALLEALQRRFSDEVLPCGAKGGESCLLL